MAVESLLLELGILFAILAGAGALAHRLGQSVIPFYLVAGLLIDPGGMELAGYSFTLVSTNEFVTGAAELGVVLLLFFLGLKFSFRSLVQGRARISKAGTVDLANLLAGVLVALVFGLSVVEALFVGGIVYISSSAVITKSLIDLNWIANPESEAILGVLVFEDLFVALYLAVLSAVALQGGGFGTAFGQVGIAVLIMLVLAGVAAFGSKPLGWLVDRPSNELALLTSLAVVVATAAVALSAGLSEAVAAFFVGMAVGATGQADRISNLATPLRDVFGAVFFFWIGLTADLGALTGTVELLAVLVVITVLVKATTGVIGGRLYGLTPVRQVRVGVGLVARGEFSLVVGALAAHVGGSAAMTNLIPSLAVGYVLVTSVIGTLAMQHAAPLERLLVPWLDRPRSSPSG